MLYNFVPHPFSTAMWVELINLNSLNKTVASIRDWKKSERKKIFENKIIFEQHLCSTSASMAYAFLRKTYVWHSCR